MDTFIKRQEKAEPGFNIAVILNKKETVGTVGLEIEVEGRDLPKGEELGVTPAPLPKQWSYHHDGSLRGDDNAEYVLRKPISFDEVDGALTALWETFEKSKSCIDESNRTSVHVHLNCQQFHMNRLTSFIALYLCFEQALTEWCGEHRVGNLFCMRAKDAPAIVTFVRRFIRSDGRSGFPDNLHYSGLNVHALSKFGSIEVRTLRGVADKQTINDWVLILRQLYEMSETYLDPRDICADFSRLGPLDFFQTIMGDKGDIIRRGVSWNDDQIRDTMYEGIRLAQDLCYCRDWEAFKKVEIKPDPFDRDTRKMAKRLVQEGLDVPVNPSAQIEWFDAPYNPNNQAQAPWPNAFHLNTLNELAALNEGPMAAADVEITYDEED